MNLDQLQWDQAGLVPGIVQDAADRRVLMLGYLNLEAIEATLATGRVYFWSRSRDGLWEKGAVSGHTLQLVEMLPDCDSDALLITVIPTGPTCHTGSATCFADRPPGQGFAGLEQLWETIASRGEQRPPGSYTAALLEGGADACARKVLEEAGELAFAAKDHAGGGSAERVAEEAADLIYHLLVLLAQQGVEPAMVLATLRDRAAQRPAEPGRR